MAWWTRRPGHNFVQFGAVNAVIGLLYLEQGGGQMGGSMSKLEHVYVGSTSDEVEALLIADWNIEDESIQNWLNGRHASFNIFKSNQK